MVEGEMVFGMVPPLTTLEMLEQQIAVEVAEQREVLMVQMVAHFQEALE
jgi:hypothetical protein